MDSIADEIERLCLEQIALLKAQVKEIRALRAARDVRQVEPGAPGDLDLTRYAEQDPNYRRWLAARKGGER